MRRSIVLGVVIVLSMALAACAPAAATATSAPAVAPTISVPAIGETPTAIGPASGASTDATGAGLDAAATSTVEAALATSTPEAGTTEGAGSTTDTSVRISTSTSPNVREPFLVDQQGRALYLFTTDTQNGGASACTGDCLKQWPPVIVTGTPQAGQGVDANLLGTITRDDGTLQATYNGWPLYTYVSDTGPGTTSGQGVGGVWFLVSGTGNSIQ